MSFMKHPLQILFWWLGGSHIWGRTRPHRFLSFLGVLPFVMAMVAIQYWYRWSFIPDIRWGGEVIIHGHYLIVALFTLLGCLGWVGLVWLSVGLYATHDVIWPKDQGTKGMG